MSVLRKAKNTVVQGGIAATQVNGNVYNSPAEITNVSVANIQNNHLRGLDLLHQYTSSAALLDAGARHDPPRCMEGTRQAIIQEILDWLKKVTKSSSILWLQGPVGHGKTALEFTIAEICRNEGLLIGSFFFSNRIANCTDGKLLFTTLAAQLIRALPSTRRYIDKAIREDPRIFEKALKTQMEVLIVEPIQRTATMARVLNTVTLGLKPYPTLIVIDGLDECANPDDQNEIIKIIGDLTHRLRIPLRFLIASRPEPNICKAFKMLQSRLSRNSVSTLLLTEDAMTRRDIQTFFKTKFDELRARHTYLPAGWPGPDIILWLVDKASGQFIYATTVIIYISSPDDRPDVRLNVILQMLETPVGDAPYAPLDQLYSCIVKTVKHREEVLLILGQLILAKEMSNEGDILGSPSNSTSQKRVEVILNLPIGDATRLLNSMHSVIDVGEDLKLLHVSFQDFLLDPSRSNNFAVNLIEARTMLGMAYIRVICGPHSICVPWLSSLLHSRFTLSVKPANKFKPDLSKMRKALQYCSGERLFERLFEELKDTDIVAEYELCVLAAPWKRYPATLVFGWICAILTEGGSTRFQESEVDARLKALWDSYTWEVVPDSKAAAHAVLDICLLDGDHNSNFASAMEFLIKLTNCKLPHLPGENLANKHVVLKSPNTDDVLIRFNVWASTFEQNDTMRFLFHDENYHFIHNDIIMVPHTRNPVGELQAWEMLAAACHQWEWLK